ncbi:MAG: copper resistance system multicopper oxidase [Acidobacteriota bacterium]|nr:copper resistance system multicopper oxidase [Acidobacteriota bacterium]
MAKHDIATSLFSRRQLINGAGAFGLTAALARLMPAYAQIAGQAQSPALSGNVIDLVIADTPFHVGSRAATAMTINGTLPGPLIRLKEGQDVTLNVTNRLKETASIHWHGVLLPPGMDGVPGVSFAGIKPGTTFTYRFPIKQNGTYWFHSHSGGQEQRGVYAPMIIDSIEPDPVQYDREYLVMLSDWSFASADTMIGDLKKQSGYFNYQQRTMGEFFSDVSKNGWQPTVSNYLLWSRMRMDPTDLLDVTSHSYTYLMNGLPSESNWTALFRPGERVRLRFIQVGVMTFQDVRIPGLKMTVVQADGQNVQPVEVDEFRMGPAETYDVIVEPKEDRAYTIFAETLDRSGYARGTLAPRPGLSAAIPERRARPIRTMEDMGMVMGGTAMGGMKPAAGDGQMAEMKGGADLQKMLAKPAENQMQDMTNMPGMQTASEIPGLKPVKSGPDHYGSANQATPMFTSSRLDKPGIGLGDDGRRVLVYTDLKSLSPYPDQRKPERELEIHLTGNMERFMWSLDGKKYSQAKEPVHFRYGERLRWTFVNDTMMEHTMHLHGMWMYLENGAGEYLPRKHTVLVKPAERVSVAITPDTRGRWAFHCHLLLHMEVGMFRVVEVSDKLSELRS